MDQNQRIAQGTQIWAVLVPLPVQLRPVEEAVIFLSSQPIERPKNRQIDRGNPKKPQRRNPFQRPQPFGAHNCP